jgi:hypothetical protein
MALNVNDATASPGAGISPAIWFSPFRLTPCGKKWKAGGKQWKAFWAQGRLENGNG